MQNFGEYLKELRLKKGLNQTELAALIGLDSGGLSKIENGKKQLGEKKIEPLANALDVDISELKVEYFSEKFARESFEYKCSDTVFKVAEEKVRYYKSSKVQQGKLNLK